MPFSKSDDVANERAEVQIHEHLFNHSNIGVVTGSNKDKSKKYETTNNNTTKRLGEVDYTKAESLKLLLLILQENTNININDLNKSLSVKDTGTITRVHF